MELDKEIGGENDISLYVGIPFCPSRVITARSYRRPRSPVNSSSRIWTRSAARSRRDRRLSGRGRKQVQNVYIGGGTPTTLDEHQLARLLSALADSTLIFTFARIYCRGRPPRMPSRRKSCACSKARALAASASTAVHEGQLFSRRSEKARGGRCAARLRRGAAGRLPRDQYGRHRRPDRRYPPRLLLELSTLC